MSRARQVLKTLEANMSPGEFHSTVAEVVKARQEVYNKLHKLKFEMDNWGSHNGMSDFTPAQQKFYNAIGKSLDADEKLFRTLTDLQTAMKALAK